MRDDPVGMGVAHTPRPSLGTTRGSSLRLEGPVAALPQTEDSWAMGNTPGLITQAGCLALKILAGQLD